MELGSKPVISDSVTLPVALYHQMAKAYYTVVLLKEAGIQFPNVLGEMPDQSARESRPTSDMTPILELSKALGTGWKPQGTAKRDVEPARTT